MTIKHMGIAYRIPKSTNTHAKYVIFVCFFTSTVVARKRLNITLYVHYVCLSPCIQYPWISPTPWLSICRILCEEYTEAKETFEHQPCSLWVKNCGWRKTSNFENRNSWWIRLCNSTWKPLHVLKWAANDWKDV